MLQKNQMKKRLKNKGILGITDFEKCRKMSNYAKSDWQMTVTLHSSDSLFLYTSFCGVLVRHDKEKSYICINGSP